MLTYFLGGVVEMLTVADMGEGGVKNGQKSADVLYGWPLRVKITGFTALRNLFASVI